jgi:hypothetical protein
VDELRERLAALEHERWSDWMLYLFGKCTLNTDGTMTIPAWAVERWLRQANAPYEQLSEEEKDADRREVGRYWALLPGAEPAAAGRDNKGED